MKKFMNGKSPSVHTENSCPERKDGVGAAMGMLLAVTAIIFSTAYLVCRLLDEQSYHEKWKDYIDCGLA